MRNGVFLFVVAAVAGILAGCGGSTSDTSSASLHFDRAKFDITFTYPNQLKGSALRLGTTAGAADTAQAGVGIDRDNVIFVSRYDLSRAVTRANLGDVKGESDDVIGRLAGQPISGAPVEYGGLPGYRYRVALGSPEGGVSRLYVLFDKRVEYFFNCQSTPESRQAMDRACDEALRTLERR